jgi:hypothetical protein
MEKTWMPVIAGILNIICGASQILGGIILFIIVIIVGVTNNQYITTTTDIVSTIIFFPMLIAVIFGIISINGGVRALNRMSWGWALAGSISSFFSPLWFLGITSIVFIALSRKEFQEKFTDSYRPFQRQ